MTVPTISHLQAFILCHIADANGGEVEAATLNKMVVEVQGVELTNSAFRAQLNGMERLGLVKYRFAPKYVRLSTRIFRATPEGLRQLAEVQSFYDRMN